jgi:ribosomal protein S3
MGQKLIQYQLDWNKTNRHFESCWYSDYQYSHLLNQDLRVKLYINNILKQLGCPEGHISMIYMAKK